ncbi:MAG: iron ABC transporter permease [Nitrospirales bacterium]
MVSLPRPAPLSLLAVGIAALLTFPLLYVTYSAFTGDLSKAQDLWTTRIPELLYNTFLLALSVSFTTLTLGISTAWVITRYQFWGRAFWDWGFVLPLAIPSFVLAYVYTYLLDTAGPVEQTWQWFTNSNARIPSPYSFTGALVVMSLNTFPYVYLLARAAFQNFNLSFEEAAQATGATRWETFFRVSLPLIRPALVASMFLVVLYVVSDFGAVSLLRFQTFTYAIFQQITGRFDYQSAALLSLLLVGFALVFLFSERWFRKQSRFYQTSGRVRTADPKPCSFLKASIINATFSCLFAAAFGIPVLLLIQWTITAWANGEVSLSLWGYIGNSLFLSATAATVALGIGTPLAYVACRIPSRLHMACLQGAYIGYVLPGPVAALALLMLFTDAIPFLYGTAFVLILAYLVHFLPAGLQAMEAALQQVHPNLEEAARNLGAKGFRTFFHVTFPLVRKGFFAAWILMFLLCMKELPATLLLRPIGFDTLAVRIWLEASEELYQLAAPPALLIVLLTIPAVFLLSKRGG